MSTFSAARSCPCGTGLTYDACCGGLHRGERAAVTAEELMRSRYAAYAVGDSDYLFRSWHPRTRPPEVFRPDGTEWVGLQIVEATGGRTDDEGVVEFRASYRGADGRTDVLHERSRFVRRAGRWVYLDGDMP